MLFKTLKKHTTTTYFLYYIPTYPLGLHQWINNNYTIVLLLDIVSGNKKIICPMITNNSEVNKI